MGHKRNKRSSDLRAEWRMETVQKNRFGYQLFQVILGLAIAGVAFYMIVKADIGLSPWDAFAMAVSYYVPITYGQSVQLIGVVVLAADLLMHEKIGLGTIADVLIVGWVIDLMSLWDPMPQCETILGGCIVMVIALLLIGLGQFLYMRAGLSCGPRDALTVGIGRRMRRLPIGAVQCIMQGVVFVIALVLGGPIGVGTFVFAFGAGPAAQLVFNLCRFEPRDVQHEGFFQSLERLKLRARR